MSRRISGLAAVAASAIGVALVPAGAAATGGPPPAITAVQAQKIGTDAYVYGISLMEFLRTARQQTSVTVPDSKSDAPINRLGNARRLATPSNHVIVQPNNDTLYTMGHLDLSRGPLVLHVPKVKNHRYYSFEFMDPYTNVFAYVGTRTTGDGAGNFLIVGPHYHGTAHGLRVIRSPYVRAWAVGRTLVNGSSDLAAVHKVQNGYRLLPLSKFERFGINWKPPRPRHVVRTPKKYSEPTGLAFFDQLGVALAQNRPPARDAAILKELRTVGIGPGLQPSKEHLSAAIVSGLRAAVRNGPQYVIGLKTKVAAGSVVATRGWFVPPKNLGAYGTDYQLRAVVAINGLAANRPAEAMYIVGATDSSLQFLNAARDYLIHFPAGQLPPARYFWSLTMYNQSFYLVSNPLKRYEIGNRTAGLKRNADGSLDIYIQHTAPPGHTSNWLPAPASGTFQVTLRLYGPRPTALNRTYRYPPIVRVG
jgi:hypothetical protein